MKNLSYFVLLAAPAAYLLDKILGLGIVGLIIVLAAFAVGLATYKKTKDDASSRKRYKIGISLSGIYLALVAVLMVFVIPSMKEAAEETHKRMLERQAEQAAQEAAIENAPNE